MATATYAQVLDRLNTRLADTADTTFTSGQKAEFLTKAYNDKYNTGVGRDTSLTTAASTYSYAMPSGYSDIYELYIDLDGTGAMKTPVQRENYDVIGSTLHIDTNLTAGKSLILIGAKQFTTDETALPELNQDYVIEIATLEAMRYLKHRYAMRFLKNDLTMGEVLQAIQECQQAAAELRSQLMNQRLVVL